MKGSSASSSAARSDDRSSFAPNRPDRFALNGPSRPLDARLDAARGDIADVALAGRVFAPRYALPLPQGCVLPRTAIRAAPARDAVAVSELLLGETFAVVDVSGDWAWGFGAHDHYVGYVCAAALGPVRAVTHRVATPAALVFANAHIKSAVVRRLPFGARIEATADEGGFVRTADGFVHRRHVAPLDVRADDPVAVAERLIGVPYRWGGRSGDGIDCSGLVQVAFGACGVALPRDSDQQRAAARALAPDEPARRGDLLFLPGHVGMLADPDTLLHANAHWMMTVREPLAAVLARQPAAAVWGRIAW